MYLVITAAIMIFQIHSRELKRNLTIGWDINGPEAVSLAGIIFGSKFNLAKRGIDHLIALGIAHVGHGQASRRLPNVAIVGDILSSRFC